MVIINFAITLFLGNKTEFSYFIRRINSPKVVCDGKGRGNPITTL